jgi:beta-lactamase class A
MATNMQHNKLIQDISYPRRSHTRSYAPPSQLPQLRPTPRPVSQQKPRIKPSIFIALLAVVLVGVLIAKNIPMPGKNAAKASQVLAANEPPEEILPKIDTIALQNQINAIIAQYPNLQISVSYADIKSSASLHLGVQEPYIAASTAKLLTATLFLSEVEKGTYKLDQNIGGASARSQLQLLIEKSDNNAWVAFNDLLGHPALEQFAHIAGMTTYNSESNISTSADIATLLQQLYSKKLLNDEHTQLLLSYMQNASENQYIPAAIPQGTKVYHKAGYLKDRAHDAAIVDNGKQPFVLVIFTKANSGSYDFALGTKIMHDLTAAVLAAYTN